MHLLRNMLRYASGKYWDQIAATDIRPVYTGSQPGQQHQTGQGSVPPRPQARQQVRHRHDIGAASRDRCLAAMTHEAEYGVGAH